MRRKRTQELPLTDFEGRIFGSYAEMAAFYGIDANLLHARWRYGKMTLKECLTKPVNKSRAHRRPVTDCCGQEFDNATAMCRNIERTAQKLADIDLDEIVATELAKRCMKDPAGRMIVTEMLKKMRERAADKESKECQQEY